MPGLIAYDIKWQPPDHKNTLYILYLSTNVLQTGHYFVINAAFTDSLIRISIRNYNSLIRGAFLAQESFIQS